MLTDKQIQEEAEKRIAAMSHRERRALEVEIRDGIYLSENVSKFGYKVLSKEERRRYHMFNQKMMLNGVPTELAELEAVIKGMAGDREAPVTQEEIAAMKKNPFFSDIKRALLIAALLVIGGNLLAALIEKLSGLDMTLAYIGFSSVSGYLALKCSKGILYALRFRRLQKAYADPDFQEKQIQRAIYRSLHETVRDQVYRGYN